jgi:hypothetical protein
VRLWDLRTPTCQAVLAAPAPPVAAFDEQGLVFAAGANSGVIKLYDAAQYGKGPFQTFVVRSGQRRRPSPLRRGAAPCCRAPPTRPPGGPPLTLHPAPPLAHLPPPRSRSSSTRP